MQQKNCSIQQVENIATTCRISLKAQKIKQQTLAEATEDDDDDDAVFRKTRPVMRRNNKNKNKKNKTKRNKNKNKPKVSRGGIRVFIETEKPGKTGFFGFKFLIFL